MATGGRAAAGVAVMEFSVVFGLLLGAALLWRGEAECGYQVRGSERAACGRKAKGVVRAGW